MKWAKAKLAKHNTKTWPRVERLKIDNFTSIANITLINDNQHSFMQDITLNNLQPIAEPRNKDLINTKKLQKSAIKN